MGKLVARRRLTDVLDAYTALGPRPRLAVWSRDDEVDEHYNSLFRELLTYMMGDPRTITACAHLLFVAKNLERIGDHATNIAEIVHYEITGEEMISAAGPKTDALQSLSEVRLTVTPPISWWSKTRTPLATLLQYNLEKEGYRRRRRRRRRGGAAAGRRAACPT